jgi:hypothetical protein
MRRTIGTRVRQGVTAVALVLLATGVGGCGLQEAVVDGVYGGISDTVAAALSNLLLRGG